MFRHQLQWIIDTYYSLSLFHHDQINKTQLIIKNN